MEGKIGLEAVGRKNRLTGISNDEHVPKIVVSDNGERSFNLRACSSSNHSITESRKDVVKENTNILSMSPLSFGEKFEDAYNIVLVLDNRELFVDHSSRSRRMIENICSQLRPRFRLGVYL